MILAANRLLLLNGSKINAKFEMLNAKFEYRNSKMKFECWMLDVDWWGHQTWIIVIIMSYKV